MKRVDLKEFADNIDYYIGLESNFYISYDNKETYVLIGENVDINIDYCLKNNIKIINIKHKGGSVILTESAVGFAHIGYDFDNKISSNLISAFVKFLKDKNLDAIYDGNDVLVNGYKTSSCGKVIIKNKTYFVFQVSLDNDINLIKSICTKPMIKTPKGLSEFGITKEEIIKFFEEFAKENFYKL